MICTLTKNVYQEEYVLAIPETKHSTRGYLTSLVSGFQVILTLAIYYELSSSYVSPEKVQDNSGMKCHKAEGL